VLTLWWSLVRTDGDRTVASVVEVQPLRSVKIVKDSAGDFHVSRILEVSKRCLKVAMIERRGVEQAER
jgi:hypothetical protein